MRDSAETPEMVAKPFSTPHEMNCQSSSEADDWTAPPDRVWQPEGQVHVWRLHLDIPEGKVGRLRALLSRGECARADRFQRAEHGRRFTVAHGTLRRILSEYLECAPESIRFGRNEYGKPFLPEEMCIEFNLSHSGDAALVAVTRGRAIGVDIEHYRKRLETEKISKRYFSPAEAAVLFKLPEGERERAFYACWTRKEAYIKARGEGLSIGLKRFDVAFAPGASPALLRSDEGPEEVGRWKFVDIVVQSGYAAACVVEGQVGELRLWDAR